MNRDKIAIISILIVTFFALKCECDHRLKPYHNPFYWPNRTGIVHLFEWTFADVAEECERFLAPNGYGAVQLSPINENLVLKDRPWFERYQPISYKIVTRSGSERELLNMTKRCNAVGIRIFVDVILNHMTVDVANATGVAGSRAKPENLDYPAVSYTKDDFNHPICMISNYADPIDARNCELLGLHDLDQSKEHVRHKLLQFLNRLIDLGVTGFRIDAAKHMWPEDLKVIYDRIKNIRPQHGIPQRSRPFIYQEVSDSWKFDYRHLGAVTEFSNGLIISQAIRNEQPLAALEQFNEKFNLLPSKDALVFIDNHDTQRTPSSNVLTYKNQRQYKMAVAFMLAYPYGIPRVMSSYAFADDAQGPPKNEQDEIVGPKINANGSCAGGWVCEHRWIAISNMIGFRNAVQKTNVTHFWSDGDGHVSFCRGNKGFIAFNTEEGRDLSEELQTCLPEGKYCNVIGDFQDRKCLDNNNVIDVDKNGIAKIEIPANASEGVLAIHIGSKIA